MRHILLISLILACVFVSYPAAGQQRAHLAESSFSFFETLTFPTGKESLFRLDINYRILKSFFVFTRTSVQDADFEFEGGIELSIEIFDTRGQSRAREITQRSLHSDSATFEFPDIEYITGSLTFELPPGEYRLLIQVHDRNSQRRYTDRDRRVTIPDYRTDLAVFDILFIEPIPQENRTYRFLPVNLGGNIFFNSHVQVLVSFTSPSEHLDRSAITVGVHRLSEGSGTDEVLDDKTFNAERIFPGTLLSKEYADDVPSYHVIQSDKPGLQTALIPLNGLTLDEGQYRISVSIDDGNRSAEKSKSFRVIWIDKPLSLRNLDFAIEMLEYITSDEEYRQLRRGSQAERRRKFFEYWRGKDPEPRTPFNPVMTEFYRRVDIASRDFSTIRERNGARTDRGKIYIIYGPPSQQNRELTPGQPPQEIWIYTHLNQKFIFVDRTRQGNYRLVTREEL
jgi:GWxTD domain-containing protein